MEENLFPRGKAKPGPTSGLKKRPKHVENTDFLFSEKKKFDEETRKSVKRKRKFEKDDPLKEHDATDVSEILEDREDFKVDFFHSKRVQEGMLLLGCIREIHELELVVGLPHCNTGYVQANQISETYTSQIRHHLDGDTEELVPLSKMFEIGDIVVCGVLNQAGSKKLQLTLNPLVINKYLSGDEFFNGQMISGAVKSEEDHGYAIDIGKSAAKAFLPLNETGGRKFPLGSVVRATITNVRGEGSILILSLDKKKIIKSSVKEGQKLSLDALLPGMTGAFKPMKKTKSGVAGRFMGYSASICAINCDMDELKIIGDDHDSDKKARKVKKNKKDKTDEAEDPAAKENKKQETHVRGCVLYVNPLTKHIGISASPFVLNPEKRDQILKDNLTNFPRGQKCTISVLKCFKGLGAALELENGIKGFCPTKHMSDEKFSDFSEVLGNRKSFPARVMQSVSLDGSVVCTLKKTIVENEFYSYKNVIPGAKIDCTIQSVQDSGVLVTLGKNVYSPIKGFVPKIHLADVLLQHPEKKFSKGDVITCRVLTVKKSISSIQLTHKRTLLKSKLPIITSYDQLEQNLIVHGYIASIKPYGVFINFYNNVHGLVPNGQLATELLENPENTFFVGQIMKVRVLSCDPGAERARLSFILKPKRREGESSDKNAKNAVSVEVVQKNEDGFDVIVCDSSKPKRFWNRGVLPKIHLSDFPSLASLWFDSFCPGDILNNCVVISKRKEWLITRKNSILSSTLANEEDRQFLTFSDLQEGLVSCGFIHHIESYGVFVQLPGGLVGLCPKSKMADKFLLNSDNYYHQGQSVVAKVIEIDAERKRFIVTLRESECPVNTQHATLEAYITEMERAISHFDSSWGENIAVGKHVSIKISGPELSPNEYPCENPTFPDSLSATVIDAKEYETGREVKATLLFIDAKNKKITLSANTNFTAMPKEDVALEGNVQCVNEDTMSVVAKNKKKAVVALALTRHHPNQPVYENQLPWTVSDAIEVKAANVIKGNNVVLVSDVPKNVSTHRQRNVSESSLQGETDFGNLQVGQEVEGAIKSVKHNGLLVRFTESEMEGGYRGQPVTGHLHISELEDHPTQGPVAMKKYQCWTNIKCKVIGFRDVKTHRFLAITKRNSTRCILELSLRKEPLRVQFQDLTVGQEVIAFSTNFIPQKEEIHFEVTPSVKGFVPLLLLSENPTNSLKLMHKFKKPVAWDCVVHKLLRNTAVFAGKGAMIDRNSRKDVNEIGANTVTNGKIQKIFPNSIVLSLPDGGSGKVHITNASDNYSENVFEKLAVGDIVRCAVLFCTSKKSLVLSMRNSHILPEGKVVDVKDPQIADSKNLKPGMLVRGFVKNISKSGVFVALSPEITGRASLNKASKFYIHDTSIVDGIFAEGRLVTCKILNVSQMEEKIDLSLLESDTGVTELVPEKLGLPLRHGKPHEKKKTEAGLLIDKVEGRKSKKRKLERKKCEDQKDGSVSKKKKKEINKTDEQDSGLEDSSFGDSSPAYLKIASQADEDIKEDPGFSWNAEPANKSKAESDEDDISDEDNDMEETKEAKKTKKEKEAEKAEEEAELRRKEEMLLEDKLPQTALDWDKLVLGSPQNSLLWVSYMAFHLRSTEVEKARAVAERAVKTINFQEEKEKWNVWAALLNLENSYGTEDSLTETITRACQHNDPLKVNFHMVSTFERAGKLENADELCRKMIRKFKQNKTVWMLHITHLMQNGKRDGANEIFKRSLQSLEKKFHLEVISKFAQLEYKTGDPEHGRVLFENMLSSYPKRSDLWSIYLDMLVKVHKIDEAREVFERVITLNLSTKNMRNFFKKYVDFEVKFGNDDSVTEVKEKALEYIESKTNDLDE